MKVSAIKLAVCLSGLLLLMVTLVPACAPQEEAPPAVTEKTLVVGSIQGFTGPTALPSGVLYGVAREFFKWANETNYVPGVKVELIQEDDRYDAAQVPIAYRRIMEKNPTILFSMTSLTGTGLKPLVERDKTLLLAHSGSVTTAQEPVGYTFLMNWVPELSFNCFLNYVADTWEEERPCRVASLSWDDDDGVQHIESGLATAAALGIDFKREYALVAPVGTMDFTSYVTRLKELDPDYIEFALIGPCTGSALKTMEQMGMDTKKAVHIIMSGGAMYEDVIAVAGEEATYGSTVVMSSYPWSIQTPDQERAKEFALAAHATEYGWDPRFHIDVTVYYQACKLFYEAVKIAIDDVGLENLDKDSLYNALQKIRNFETGVSLPITYGPDDRIGGQSVRIYYIGTDGIAHPKTDKVYNWPQKWGPDVY